MSGRVWRRFVTHRLALAGLVTVSVLLLAAILAPILAPRDPTLIETQLRFLAPFANASLPLGSDELGRDTLSRLLYGGRVSLTVGLVAMVTTVLTGAQRSTGLEASLTGRITPWWQAALGYGYTDATIRATTAAAPAGRTVAQVPRHQLSLWNRFDVTPRFGFGVGLYHQSRQFASISNTVALPAYTRLDAAIFYKLTDKIEAQINVENVTDTRYFPNAHNDNNISTGAPLTARATITVSF